MHTIRISIPMLKMNLSKTCPSVAERQRISKALMQINSRDALKAELEQAITKVCRAMVGRGEAGWANDPALDEAVLVEKGTGIRILSADLAPIRLMSKITHPAVAFPWSRYLPLLATKAFEDSVPHMYLDREGNVTVGIGHHIIGQSDALRLHNGPLPFARKDTQARATDDEVIAEYNRLVALKASMSNTVARKFEGLTHLSVKEADSKALVRTDAEVRINEIRNNPFREFDSYPEGVQMAIADLAFNMGSTKFRESFTKFQHAVKHRDWQTAKGESSRKDIGRERNTPVAEMFNTAIASEKYFITTKEENAKKRLAFTTEAKLKPITVN